MESAAMISSLSYKPVALNLTGLQSLTFTPHPAFDGTIKWILDSIESLSFLEFSSHKGFHISVGCFLNFLS
jgi:hypothetical protein